MGFGDRPVTQYLSNIKFRVYRDAFLWLTTKVVPMVGSTRGKATGIDRTDGQVGRVGIMTPKSMLQ